MICPILRPPPPPHKNQIQGERKKNGSALLTSHFTLLLAVIEKEILLRIRDRAGLVVLFIMPAVLVTVITLVQENLLKSVDTVETRILVINEDKWEDGGSDGDTLGARMVKAMESMDGVILIQEIEGRVPSRTEALDRVAAGAYPVCVVIPAKMTAHARERAGKLISGLMSPDDLPDPDPAAPRIELYFDPTTLGGFRSAVQARMALMALQFSVIEKAYVADQVFPNPAVSIPSEFWLNKNKTALFQVEDSDLFSAGKQSRTVSTTQHNVPAWTLFGIFFVVLPISTGFIQERASGTRHRLMTMPVSPLTLICGRVITYVGICVIQCLLIGCIGKWILPLQGAPPLVINGSGWALLAVAGSAILAAIGYGVLLGTLAKTAEQAAVIGPISVVIAAAMGGVMVPVYAMPLFMQTLSKASPMAWGLNGVLDVFVRGEGLWAVLPEAGTLLLFFFTCMATAHFREQARRG
ncbi:ABC transporter permease [Desulfosarcina sp. OttesenSCG-928-G10]|nr:ABC transporter permease [Desulfosarcina sp. OttesenSCG-928-G10]